ncbi:hypothetical protein KIN20_002254, partial [Parelaphostrongylus tenuis]
MAVKQRRERLMTSEDMNPSIPNQRMDTGNLEDRQGAFSMCNSHCSFPREGITISLWIKRFLSRQENDHRYVHLGSVIGTMMRCSFLLTAHGRIVLEVDNSGSQIARRKFKGRIKSLKWTHICISLAVTRDTIKTEGLIDDCFSKVELPFLVGEVSFQWPLEFSFGCISAVSPHSFLLSSIFVFRGQLSHPCVLILHGLGCRLSSLTISSCQRKLPSLISVLERRLVLENSLAVQNACSNTRSILEELHNAVLITLDLSRPNVFLAHSLTMPSDDVCGCTGNTEGLVSNSMQEFDVNWRSESILLQSPSVDDVILSIGSVKILLFFYVKFVNDSMPAALQVAAFDVLLSSLRRNTTFAEEANRLKLNNILVKTLSSQLAYCGNEILQLIIDHCFAWKDINDTKSGSSGLDHIVAFCPSEALIRFPDTLVTMCCRYEIWCGERFQHWKTLIAVIAKSIHEDMCPLAWFNHFQLSRCSMLQQFFHCLLEMFRHSAAFTDPSDSEKMVKDIMKIVDALISTVWNAEEVLLLWNFITISHPADATYLKHDVEGPSDWTNVCVPPDNVYAGLKDDGELCTQLRRYLEVLGSDFVSSMWGSGATIFDIHGISTPPDRYEEHYVDVDKATSLLSLSWIVPLRRSMMMKLNEVLQNGSDSLITVLREKLSWEEILILLTCQEDLSLREAVVKLLQNFMKRSTNEAQSSFLQMDGFSILANQLADFGVTHAMADSLFSLMCGEPILLSDGLDVALIANMPVNKLSCQSFLAILVALEESVADHVLFWNIIAALRKIFENNMQLQRAMFECHLIQHLVRALKKIVYLDACDATTDVTLQLDAWSEFTQLIVTSVVPYNDAMSYEYCEQFIWLLAWTDWQCSKDDKIDESVRLRAHRMIREQFCQILRCWLECIRHVFTTDVSSASVYQSKDSLNSAETPKSIAMDKSLLGGTPKQESTSFSAFLAESLSNIRTVVPSSRNYLDCPFPKRSVPFPVTSIRALSQRLLFVLEIILNVFVVLHPSTKVSAMEQDLFFYSNTFILSCLTKEQQGEKQLRSLFEPSVSSMWSRLKAISYHRIRLLLAQFVSFTIFPAQSKLASSNGSASREQLEWQATMQHALIKSLLHGMNATEHLRSFLSINMDYTASLYLGLCEIAILSPINGELESDIEHMLRFLADNGVEMVFRNFTHDSIRSLGADEVLSLHTYAEHRRLFFETLNDEMKGIREKDEERIIDVNKISMQLTSKVVAVQSSPRKEFMRKTRNEILELFSAELVLKDIANELCHPEAPCSHFHRWPVGWALDPAEGLMRERKKLIPSYYSIDASFFQQERQEAVKNNHEVHPFGNIIKNHLHSGRLALQCSLIDEHIFINLDVKLLRGTVEYIGELLVGKRAIYFLEKINESVEADCSVIKKWDFEDVVEIFPRQNMLNCNALEIFLHNGHTYIIVFKSEEERDGFKMVLFRLGLRDVFSDVEELFKISMRAWRHNAITNFEYIMILNTLCGRSFNDLMQYPVFPFILADYTSRVLDLQSQSSFRDLAKPMAIQDSRMEAHYINNYKSIEVECNQRSTDMCVHFAPYHYGSHYSNIGIVTYYLVRLYPYTEVAIKYQDNNFDIADRIFNSIEDAWRLSSSESTTDFKELTPEFFSLPEFLRNHEKFDLGTRQGGEVVGDVKLPDWVPDSNPRLFILIHRQALESSIVTQNLHLWIDLVFGFKQSGRSAVDAINVFHPSTYSSTMNNIGLMDEVSQSALSTMVRSYGQMPMQILRAPHQPHLSGFRMESEIYPAPVESVRGIRWGDYVGNPLQSDELINVVFSLETPSRKQSLRVIALPNGLVVGVPYQSLLVYRSTRRRKLAELVKFTQVTAIGVVSVRRHELQLGLCAPKITSWFSIAELDGF